MTVQRSKCQMVHDFKLDIAEKKKKNEQIYAAAFLAH